MNVAQGYGESSNLIVQGFGAPATALIPGTSEIIAQGFLGGTLIVQGFIAEELIIESLPIMSSVVEYNAAPAVSIDGLSIGPTVTFNQLNYRAKNIRTFSGPVYVQMTSPYANSQIRYEYGCKSPTCGSRLYTGPENVLIFLAR